MIVLLVLVYLFVGLMTVHLYRECWVPPVGWEPWEWWTLVVILLWPVFILYAAVASLIDSI